MLLIDIQSADEMQDDLATVLSPERANEEKFSVPLMMKRHVRFLQLQHTAEV